MNLDKSLSKRKNEFSKCIDNEYVLTEWLMRRYEADFGQILNDWNILQITQFLKIQRTTLTEQFCWAKTLVIFKNKFAKQKLKKSTDEEKLHQLHKIQRQDG